MPVKARSLDSTAHKVVQQQQNSEAASCSVQERAQGFPGQAVQQSHPNDAG